MGSQRIEEINVIRLGALLHDVGKFWQRTGEAHKEKFSKLTDEDYGRTGAHSKWSASFVEDLGLDKDVVNSVLYHHAPSSAPNEIRGLVSLIQRADQLSAGERKKRGYEVGEVVKEPLVSVFSKINIKRDNIRRELPDDRYYYPKKLTLSKESLFPKLKRSDAMAGWHLQPEYKELWKEFKEETGNIPHSTLDSLFTSLYWLLQKYTSFIPSAVYRDFPDISLFDHLKTTCAIAECLYKNNGEENFLLIGGDISGIQNFIYSITSKGAAKSLRGRSFYLQLLTETIARYVLDRLGMSIANLLYCGGGHFYILAPSNPNIENKLEEVRREIGQKLLEGHHGELYLVLDWVSFFGREFEEKGKFGDVWSKIVHKLAEKKKSKFAEILEDRYEEIFGPRDEGGTKDICEICGSEKHVKMDDEGRKKCVRCESFEKLAKNIATANYMVEIVGDREIKRILDGGTWEDVIASFGVRYEFPRTKTLGSDELRKIDAEKVIVYRLNDTRFLMNLDLTGVKTPVAFGFKFLANATPWANNKIKDFGELADGSEGIDRWAVLRMDVDYLGKIFSEGLGTDRTVSRVSTLSSLLSLFFSGWMEKICKRHSENIYAIYSGGDDLFIVGSWSVIPEIAKEIYNDFKEFSCQNLNITLSGGIYIAPSKKYPLYMAADLAGKALEKSKGVEEKDAITFLDMPVKWSMFNNEITQLKSKLLELINAGVSRALLQKLYSIYSEFDRQRKKRGETLAKYDDRYGRWRWLLAYVIARMKVPDDKREVLEEVGELVRHNIEHLPIAVRWVELLTREKEEGLT